MQPKNAHGDPIRITGIGDKEVQKLIVFVNIKSGRGRALLQMLSDLLPTGQVVDMIAHGGALKA